MLLDKIEDAIDDSNTKQNIKNVPGKVKEYYQTTDGRIYIIATNELKTYLKEPIVNISKSIQGWSEII
nr:2094_t:CDS:2 [Entrophospora candida]